MFLAIMLLVHLCFAHYGFIFSVCHMSVNTEIFKGMYLLENIGGQTWGATLRSDFHTLSCYGCKPSFKIFQCSLSSIMVKHRENICCVKHGGPGINWPFGFILMNITTNKSKTILHIIFFLGNYYSKTFSCTENITSILMMRRGSEIFIYLFIY